MRDKRFLPFMLVTIKGSKKEYRDLVRRAVWFYAEKLMSKTLVNTLGITVNLTRNLTEKEGAEGFCIWDDWSDIRKTPREYTIDLDCSMSIRNILINLAHEMVHVKQWVKGEMYEYSNSNMVRFMKKKYDMNDMDYFDYPWEIEAFGRQLGLFIHWCEVDGLGDREDMKEII
tara:strand:+ start:341 stop:856 length:516 start_codon:yes stop_codon:yes gene_type:complete